MHKQLFVSEEEQVKQRVNDIDRLKGVNLMGKCQDVYNEVRVFEYPNTIIRVHRPDISDEERARRMNVIRKAAEALLKEVHKK